MKYLISFMLLANIANAADYGNAIRYPVTTEVSSDKYTISVESVVQSTIYSREDSASMAAVALSQKCSCKVVVNKPIIIYETTWRDIPKNSSSSATSSSVSVVPKNSVLTMLRPKNRMDGSPLAASDIAGYKLVKTPPGAPIVSLIIPAQPNDPIVYTLPWTVSSVDKLQVAAFDTNGLYSDFVDIKR